MSLCDLCALRGDFWPLESEGGAIEVIVTRTDHKTIRCGVAILLAALLGCAHTPNAGSSVVPPKTSTNSGPWLVLPNDFWDATERPSLFYFRAEDALLALGHNCPDVPPTLEGNEWEYDFVPWLQSVCRTAGAHAFPREGGLRDASATMRTLRTARAPGFVCCGHQTFEEMGHPGNYQLIPHDDHWQCSEGTLFGLEHLAVVGTHGLRCEGAVVWPDIAPRAE